MATRSPDTRFTPTTCRHGNSPPKPMPASTADTTTAHHCWETASSTRAPANARIVAGITALSPRVSCSRPATRRTSIITTAKIMKNTVAASARSSSTKNGVRYVMIIE